MPTEHLIDFTFFFLHLLDCCLGSAIAVAIHTYTRALITQLFICSTERKKNCKHKIIKTNICSPYVYGGLGHARLYWYT